MSLIKKSQHVKRNFSKLVFVAMLVAAALFASSFAISQAQAYQDDEFLNSEENIDWQNLWGDYSNNNENYNWNNYENSEYENNNSQQNGYTITIFFEYDDDMGYVDYLFGGGEPIEYLTFDYDEDPLLPAMFLIDPLLNNLTISSGKNFPDDIYVLSAFAKEGCAFKNWEVTLNDEPYDGYLLKDGLTFTAHFFEKTSITGVVCDSERTPFPDADVKFETWDGDTFTTKTQYLDPMGGFSLDVPYGSTGRLTISYNNGIAQGYLPETIDIFIPITDAGLNVGTVYLEPGSRISGSIQNYWGANVDADIVFIDDASGKWYTSHTSDAFGRTSFNMIVPTESTGILYVYSPYYIRAKRVLKDPIPAEGLQNVDFVMSAGATLTIEQSEHCTLLYNDNEYSWFAHVPIGSEIEIVNDGYYGYINIWDPEAHGEGDYPYDIITCIPEKGYEFESFNFFPEISGNKIYWDTTISANVKTATDSNPILYGFITDKNEVPIEKAYVSFYSDATGISKTVTTNKYGYYKLPVDANDKGLLVVTANNYATTTDYVTIPDNELLNELNITLYAGYNAILIGETGHAMFSATFYHNGVQYGPTIALGNPEHLGATEGATITVNADNSLTYRFELDSNNIEEVHVVPMAKEVYDFDSWIYREDVRQLLPNTTISVTDDTTLDANYNINWAKVFEQGHNGGDPMGPNPGQGGLAPKTDDFTSLSAFFLAAIAIAAGLVAYRKRVYTK